MLTFDLTLVHSKKLSASESEKTRFVCTIPVMIQSLNPTGPLFTMWDSQRMVRRGREGGRVEDGRLRGDEVG